MGASDHSTLLNGDHPITERSPAERPPLTIAHGVHRPKIRIIVADDHSDTAATLCMILRHKGFEAWPVLDGGAVLNMARELRPGVLLLDIQMPGMNGYEIARAVRIDPLLKDLLLVALTGHATAADKARALEAGFDHHFVKPARTEDLLHAIGAGMSRAGAGSA
jgi:two-component system, sensor histidine kinase